MCNRARAKRVRCPFCAKMKAVVYGGLIERHGCPGDLMCVDDL